MSIRIIFFDRRSHPLLLLVNKYLFHFTQKNIFTKIEILIFVDCEITCFRGIHNNGNSIPNKNNHKIWNKFMHFYEHFEHSYEK